MSTARPHMVQARMTPLREALLPLWAFSDRRRERTRSLSSPLRVAASGRVATGGGLLGCVMAGLVSVAGDACGGWSWKRLLGVRFRIAEVASKQIEDPVGGSRRYGVAFVPSG